MEEEEWKKLQQKTEKLQQFEKVSERKKENIFHWETSFFIIFQGSMEVTIQYLDSLSKWDENLPEISSQTYWENIIRIITTKEQRHQALPTQVQQRHQALPTFSKEQLELQKQLLQTPKQPSKEQLELQKLLLQPRLAPATRQPIPTGGLQPFFQQPPPILASIDKPKRKAKEKKWKFDEQEVKKEKNAYLTTLTFFFL